MKEDQTEITALGIRTGIPPRPDYHWVKGIGRVLQDPKGLYPRDLPAPPDVAVWVAGDIATDVKRYAERRELEKRALYPTFQRGWALPGFVEKDKGVVERTTNRKSGGSTLIRR